MGLLDFLKTNKKEDAAQKVPKASNFKSEKKSEIKDKKEETGKLLKQNKKERKENKKEEVKKTTSKDTKDAYKILIKPMVTEKATATGTYFFRVNRKTNKQEIKKAIQVVYGVDPAKVNIMNFSGRKVRWGKSTGKTKAWKKAIVYLKPGDNIEIYEGV